MIKLQDNNEKSIIISAVEATMNSNIDLLTLDRIEALTGGHGMLNLAVHNVVDVITEEVLRGSNLKMEFANVRKLPIEDIMLKAINVAKNAGADGANAALIVATTMYLAGTNAQVGIPAGNRKLGATARMLAGVDRCGVSAIPTAKMNSKLSGFPAVQAIYDAIRKGELTSIDGADIPIAGALYGHSTVGEDIVWPELGKNGARIGTEAMLKSMRGAAIKPNPFTAAILGSAAILEIIHPDAEVPDGVGRYGRMTSAYLVGQSAAETAGLPEKIHIRVTGEEFDTAAVVGDIGLILKDIGGPSVIGMMAFNEIISAFAEDLAGGSCGPSNPPMGHIAGYCVVAMKALFANEGDVEKTRKEIAAHRWQSSFEPDVAPININLIANKAKGLYNGPITRLLIEASEPFKAKALHIRAVYAYDELTSGKSLAKVVKDLEDHRLWTIEDNASRIFSKKKDKDVKIKFTRVANQARRTDKITKKYLGFDPLIDVTVTMDDKTVELKGLVHDILAKLSKKEREDIRWAVELGAPVAGTLATAGCCVMNVVIPAAIAVSLDQMTAKEAGTEAEVAAYISAGIPGAKANAIKAAQMTLEIVKNMKENLESEFA